jgi:hypothetical protein
MAIGYNESLRGNTQDDLQVQGQIKQAILKKWSKLDSMKATKIAQAYYNEVVKGLGVKSFDDTRLDAFLRTYDQKLWKELSFQEIDNFYGNSLKK